MPWTFLTQLSVPNSGPNWLRNAPILAKFVSRSARKLPSASSASSPITSLARPWPSETKLPERSSVHFTGRPSARGVKEANIFRKHGGLHAERAADLAGQHVHVFAFKAERCAKMRPTPECARRWTVKHESAVIACGNRPPRLDAIDHEPAVHKIKPGDMRCARESGFPRLGVAVVIIECDIARHIVVKLWRAIVRGFFCGNHRGQGLDVDDDCLSRVYRLHQRRGNHAGNGIADITHAIGRQCVTPRFFQR